MPMPHQLGGRNVLRRTPVFLVIGVLFTCNLFGLLIFNRLEHSAQNSPSGKHPNQTTAPNHRWRYGQSGDVLLGATEDRVHILDVLASRAPFKFDVDKQSLDASRKYKIARRLLSPQAKLAPQDCGGNVCLATQGSLDRLSWLVDLVQLWNGPVSLAVFVANSTQFQAVKLYLSLIRFCSEAIKTNMRVDLVYPADENLTRKTVWSDELGSDFSCGTHAVLLKALQNVGKTKVVKGSAKPMLYPQNHLRNVARDGCAQRYFFLTDIDIMPKPGLWEELSHFFGRTLPCTKCVFVVPTYEMSDTAPVPRTKRELLHLVRRKEARPFHQKSFIPNQYATNHGIWEGLKQHGDGLRAAYSVKRYEFFYEPFYVAAKDVPRYDERFVGYGFTRNTQVYETHLAGFEFRVLDEAFAVHRGMQNKRSIGVWKERQNDLNRKRFVVFQRDMKRKYRLTTKKATAPAPTTSKTPSSFSKTLQGSLRLAPSS
ncbi:beta-1,4-glucuronyltransferase 1-like [Ixodes scapularis]|uniref:beta-1,4-glucuronyltransferase 1-like n=1 Tax=Ixodes scapularis TaxID=6945 RepID=UPI001A9FB6A2|nr:beta-1,4-glucuronyltransferase 1-like [Ixodes scapularis]